MPTIAELVIQEAISRGNRHIFGIPGGGSGLSLMAAAHKAGVQFVRVNNEATAAMAAAVYGRFVGGAGLCFSIQGTGGGNMAGGIASCYLDRGPVVALTDRHPEHLLGRVSLQDIHLSHVLAPMTKATMTLRPESARTTLRTAFDLAWAQRPGPVHLDLPSDYPDVAVSEDAARVQPDETDEMSGDLQAARAALEKAQRVVVFIGSDAARAGAGEEIRCLIERCRAAAIVNFQARGLLPDNHPRYGAVAYGLYIPNTAEQDFLSRADLVVMAGVDPIELHAPWPSIPTLQVQLSPQMEEPAPNATLKLFGPLRTVLGALAECAPKATGGFSEDEISQIRRNDLARYAPPVNDPFPAQAIMETARRLLPHNGILVQETGIYNVLNDHIWPVYAYGTHVNIGGSRTMGAAIPWAIGTALARPGVPILAFCGDGGFLMRLQELEVVARHGLRIVFVIFNDRQLGTIRSRQLSRGLDVPGLQIAAVDFAAIARGFGLGAAMVESIGRFELALTHALAADQATVIDARLDPDAYVGLFPRLFGATPS